MRATVLDNTHYNITLLITFVEILVIFLFVEIQSTPHNSNLQGKKKKVRVIGSLSYQG